MYKFIKVFTLFDIKDFFKSCMKIYQLDVCILPNLSTIARQQHKINF